MRGKSFSSPFWKSRCPRPVCCRKNGTSGAQTHISHSPPSKRQHPQVPPHMTLIVAPGIAQTPSELLAEMTSPTTTKTPSAEIMQLV